MVSLYIMGLARINIIRTVNCEKEAWDDDVHGLCDLRHTVFPVQNRELMPGSWIFGA